MAGLKCVLCVSPMLLLLLVALGTETIKVAEAQSSSCTNGLSNLNVCAPFVVPDNNTPPSSDCCNALEAVDHDCLCNTLRIAARLPSQCQLSSLNCDPN
nr:stamen-specific protein FIL1 [Gleditsia microphylla]